MTYHQNPHTLIVPSRPGIASVRLRTRDANAMSHLHVLPCTLATNVHGSHNQSWPFLQCSASKYGNWTGEASHVRKSHRGWRRTLSRQSSSVYPSRLSWFDSLPRHSPPITADGITSRIWRSKLHFPVLKTNSLAPIHWSKAASTKLKPLFSLLEKLG